MPYDGDIHIMYWNKVAFERPDNRAKFKAKYKYDLQPPKTWKQWDDAAEFFHGWGWDGSQAKLFGAGASYKPSGTGFSYYWWRQRFFAYGGNYFDANMKPLINGTAGVRALEEMVRTMPFYPPGVLLFESEEPKTMLIKGEVPLLHSWTSTGKRVGNPGESLIVGKAGFGIVPGAEIDGKVVHRPAITPGTRHGRLEVLEEEGSHDEGSGVHLAPGSKPQDRDGREDDHGPWRVSHLRSEKFRKLFPDADKYLDAIEQSFPFLVPDPVIPAAGRVPAQARVRDHRGAGQAQVAEGRPRQRRQGVAKGHRAARARRSKRPPGARSSTR